MLLVWVETAISTAVSHLSPLDTERRMQKLRAVKTITAAMQRRRERGWEPPRRIRIMPSIIISTRLRERGEIRPVPLPFSPIWDGCYDNTSCLPWRVHTSEFDVDLIRTWALTPHFLQPAVTTSTIYPLLRCNISPRGLSHLKANKWNDILESVSVLKQICYCVGLFWVNNMRIQ